MSTPITAAELRGTALRVRRLGEGYDAAEVDAFLARAAAALDGDPAGTGVTSEDVHGVLFHQVWRGGYDVAEVDDLLDRVADALRRPTPTARHGRAGAGAAAGAPGEALLTAADLRALHLPGSPLLAQGYVREDVDALLRRAASALTHRGASGPGLDAEQVAATTFRTTRRGGYDLGAVDDLLDRVVRALAADRAGS